MDKKSLLKYSLDIEDEEVFKETVKRLSGFFGVSRKTIYDSYFIFMEQKKKDKEKNKVNLAGIKNKYVLRHHKTILSLRQQGKSLNDIVSDLKKLNMDVSKSTVYKFLKLNEVI